MMTSEVSKMIKALHEGSMTLDEVARQFRERKWPRRSWKPPASYLEMAARAQEDPEPDVPGSFDDVIGAYDRGELSRHEYRVLSEAVAESKRAEDRRLEETGEST